MAPIFCTVAEVLHKTGSGASPIASSTTYVEDYISQAESLINTVCRFNFSDTYAALNADVKGVLKLAASNQAAIWVISWDMSGYLDRIEAEDLINILRDGLLQALSLLRDKKQQAFISGA